MYRLYWLHDNIYKYIYITLDCQLNHNTHTQDSINKKTPHLLEIVQPLSRIWNITFQELFLTWVNICMICYTGISLTRLTPATFVHIPSQDLDFRHDILLSFVLVVQWLEATSNCSFCWYWWNCWPSLFKLSFHNIQWEQKACSSSHELYDDYGKLNVASEEDMSSLLMKWKNLVTNI